MLRIVLLVLMAILISLITGWFSAQGGGTFAQWLLTATTFVLVLIALVIALTFVIARVPLKPASLAFSAFAAEYFSAVKFFCLDAFVEERKLISPANTTRDSNTHPTPKDLPVLFIHGFFCNSGFWRSYIKHFEERWDGHLGTINLEPVFGKIDSYADAIDTQINKLIDLSGKSQCLIVAHSMGGLATRSYLEQQSAHHKIKGVITLGTPHSGTLTASLAPVSNAKQMRRMSQWRERLHEQEDPHRMPHFEALIGTHDNIVSPQECASFDLANNTYLHGMSHLAMAYDQQLIEWTYDRLQQIQIMANSV